MLKSAGRRKSSQARLSGRIPLVNTSSEEEDCADMAEMDDSFDRKIEASLEVARPLDLQPQYLVRGSVARATTKYPRSSSGIMGQQARRGSVAHSSLVERRRPEVTFYVTQTMSFETVVLETHELLNISLLIRAPRLAYFSQLAGPQQSRGCLPL